MRINAELNKYLWSRGIKNVPGRVRVRMSRKRNEDEGAKSKLYTLVEHVPVASFKGMLAWRGARVCKGFVVLGCVELVPCIVLGCSLKHVHVVPVASFKGMLDKGLQGLWGVVHGARGVWSWFHVFMLGWSFRLC